MPASKKHFSIHASVVFQLGENLITDQIQALLELVKNSYDADATFCRVSIDSNVNTPHGPGQIVVQDDGSGMDFNSIERGWLTISASPKRRFKHDGLTTKLGRTPLGDKGLGRLGTQRLGTDVEIITSTGDGIQRLVDIDWSRFHSTERLELVDVDYEETQTNLTKGTTLVVSGLADLEFWRTGRDRIRTGLSQVISPYEKARDFEVFLVVNGESLDLFEIGKKLRETALLHYELSFDGDLLQTTGRAKLAYMRPDKGKKEKVLFDDLVGKDDGDELFTFLTQQKSQSEFNFTKDKGRWFIRFSSAKTLDEFDQVELVSGLPASPGPFSGEVDYFSLGSEASSRQTVFTDASEYRDMISALSGIRVYRNGFGVRVAQDWLQLGEQWTSAPSYYGLKPQNTMGYIAISARENAALLEKTDREGFTENVPFRNFREMLRWFVEDFAGKAQESLRRGWLNFKTLKARQAAEVADKAGPNEVIESVRQELQNSANYRLSLSRLSFKVSEAAGKAESCLGREAISPSQAHEVLKEIKTSLSEARSLLAEIDGYLQQLSATDKRVEVLGEQFEESREQSRQLYEMVALGLTAESLSHEIDNIASGLADRNDRILKYLRGSGPKDSKLLAHAESVKNAISSMRREISFLAPALRYVRERRDTFEVYDLVNDIYKHRLAHFTSERISVRIAGERFFPVKVNRGKLLQIFDNLLLNSEYWLREDLRLNRISQGKVDITLKKPYVLFTDNGRGVDPKIEDRIFEPFVSAKGRGKGRGLGLFIVQQLLQSENCDIRLLDERNKFDRRVTFDLDLRGILNE